MAVPENAAVPCGRRPRWFLALSRCGVRDEAPQGFVLVLVGLENPEKLGLREEILDLSPGTQDF
jgi:hypothetical protein